MLGKAQYRIAHPVNAGHAAVVEGHLFLEHTAGGLDDLPDDLVLHQCRVDDETGIQRIKDGKQMFSIDQQPYLQGFLAVSLLNGFVNYGLDLPTKPVLTGPGIVSKDNVDVTMAGAKAGAR